MSNVIVLGVSCRAKIKLILERGTAGNRRATGGLCHLRPGEADCLRLPIPLNKLVR